MQILQYKIDNATAPEEKEKWVRDEMKLYDQFNKNFPLSTPDFEVNKAMVLHNNKIDAKEEIYGLLDKGFTKAAKNVTDANAFYLYFSLSLEKYKADSTKFTANQAIDRYSFVNTMLSQLEVSHPEKSNEYKTAQRGVTALAKELGGCEVLSAYYEKNFNANKENPDWLTNALTSLTVKCSGEPIYYAMAETNYRVKATSKSAYYFGVASMKQRKFQEAIQYFTEAEALETNPLEKARLDYSLATGLLSNDKPKSKELLNKALALDPKMGKAYLFLAELYSNSAEECGKTDFEKKTIYYLATETLKKVGLVEPRLKPTADKIADGYSAKSLTAKDISNEKMNGKTVKIGCWINETITFPAK